MSGNSSGSPAFNSTEGFYFAVEDVSGAFKTFLVVSLCVIIVTATLANSAVLLGFFACRKLRSHTNCFIISLSVSDILHAVVTMPFEVEVMHGSYEGYKHSVATCEFVNTVFFIVLSSSMLNLLGVSIYRYITIAHPYFAEKFRFHHILQTLAVIWVYSIITSLLPVLGWRNYPTVIINGECLFDFTHEFFLFFYICNFFVPSFFMLFMYTMIYLIARRHYQEILKLEARFTGSSLEEEPTPPSSQPRRLLRRVKAARTLGKVFLVYIICWMPYTGLLFTYMFCFQCAFYNRVIHLLCTLLAYSNTALNPFLFAAWCHDFRAQVRKLLRCGRRTSANASYQSTAYASSVASRRM